VIYFIEVERKKNSPIKIGWTDKLQQRLISLQTASPEHLSIVATMLGGLAKEAELHARFSELRIRGEWFRPDKELVEFIKSEAQPYVPPSRKRWPVAPDPTITDQLIDAIHQSGYTSYFLAKYSELDESAVRRFMSRERDSIMLSSAARLCATLGLHLTKIRQPEEDDDVE